MFAEDMLDVKVFPAIDQLFYPEGLMIFTHCSSLICYYPESLVRKSSRSGPSVFYTAVSRKCRLTQTMKMR